MPVMRMDTVGIRPSSGIAPAGAMSPLLAKIAGQMRLWHPGSVSILACAKRL
jgi:hypothetical protein